MSKTERRAAMGGVSKATKNRAKQKTSQLLALFMAVVLSFSMLSGATAAAETASDAGTASDAAAAEAASDADIDAAETASDADAASDEVATEATLEAASLPDGAQVPDGYSESYTVRNDGDGFAITVYAAEGVVPEDAILSAALLSEDTDEYASVKDALAAEADDADEYSFAALDIHFEDATGNEVEPNGNVYVVINAEGLLSEDADTDTITVSHYTTSDGDVSAESVADAAGTTDGVLSVTDATTIQAAFATDSFSTFAISWLGSATTTLSSNEITTLAAEDFSIVDNVVSNGTYTIAYNGSDGTTVDDYTYVWYRDDGNSTSDTDHPTSGWTQVERVKVSGDMYNLTSNGQDLYPSLDATYAGATVPSASGTGLMYTTRTESSLPPFTRSRHTT